jgi:GH15 family glucan-1,4-alpha-glucosidase
MTATDPNPIGSYGLIGNLETCALVGMDGSIDWLAIPKLESASAFASLLDPDRGGRFAITPTADYESEQTYMERTNVLQTTFETGSGTGTVTDFMPVIDDDTGEEPRIRALYREVACTDGEIDFEVSFGPRFDYARAKTSVESIADGAIATSNTDRLFLSSPVSMTTTEDTASTTVSLNAYDSVWFVLQYGPRAPAAPADCERLLDETISFWREWAHDCEGDCAFVGHGHDLAVRSGLVLKLLTHRDSGALVAAPTTSLPEVLGGERNWDYRYSWVRDGAFTVQALSNLGHVDEAVAFIDRFLDLSRTFDPEAIRPLYGLEHEADLTETTLDHLAGYAHSTPVRIGNDAASQTQLDVYGELVLAIYQLTKSDRDLASEDWEAISELVTHVSAHWDERDAGIWELRGEPRHVVHSKVMCWVGLDRGIEMATENDLEAPLEEWRAAREAVREAIFDRGFNPDIGTQGSFTQTFDDDTLDASLLLLPLSGLLPFDDSRVQGTIDAVIDRLLVGDGLVRRYESGADDLDGEEGAFVLCSFWLVQCLCRADRIEEAETLYEHVLDHANPLGLLAEEVDPETGRLLGNFPQAFSHIGLVDAALSLRAAHAGERVPAFATDG